MMGSTLKKSSFALVAFSFNLLLSVYVNAKPVSTLPITNTTASDIQCPVSKTHRYLFHKESEKCYKEKSKGPCLNNMVMYALDKDKIFGECDCTENGNLPWVYHPATDGCYKTFQQSYCPAGQWLVFDDDLTPTCKLNPCLDNLSEDENAPTILFKDKCVSLGKSSELCANPGAEVVTFPANEVVPKCISDVEAYAITKTKSLPCKRGTRRDITGRCRTSLTNGESLMD